MENAAVENNAETPPEENAAMPSTGDDIPESVDPPPEAPAAPAGGEAGSAPDGAEHGKSEDALGAGSVKRWVDVASWIYA